MARVMRISSMIPGTPCVLIIDGETKHSIVHFRHEKTFIKLKGKKYEEDDLPMGEEVII